MEKTDSGTGGPPAMLKPPATAMMRFMGARLDSLTSSRILSRTAARSSGATPKLWILECTIVNT
eukprot:5653838-Pyramimonas_sp.AAC.1